QIWIAANCAPPAKTTSDMVTTSAGDSPLATARVPQSVANGMPATMAGMMSPSAARHSDSREGAMDGMRTVIAQAVDAGLNEIAAPRSAAHGSPIRPGRRADARLERAGEMRLIGEPDAQRDLRRYHARPQQVPRAAHADVDQIRMRRETDLGAEHANQ